MDPARCQLYAYWRTLAGYIVETAAEKRLRLASKALNSPVWLTRKIAEADGSETMMLASSCCLPPLPSC